MKLRFLLAPAAGLGLAAAGLFAADEAPPVPVPVTQAPPAPRPSAPAEGPDYQQRLWGPATGNLISPEKANQIVQQFRAAYDKLNKPRVLFYVNRDLVDENSGLKLTGRKEKTKTSMDTRKNSGQTDANAGSESRRATVSGENTYGASDKAAPTLTDKLTVREIEQLVGRPFRAAGVGLADQKVASSLIADQPIDHFTTATNESARKDREALGKIADIVVEILISSRNATVAGVSGDSTVAVPDIQMTAIRLSDSAILGQASSSDVLGKGQAAALAARQFDVRDITEATTLALMEDLSGSAAR